MAKRKSKFNPLKQPTETKKFTSEASGYRVIVVRGMDSVNGKFHLPQYMTGKDFRTWREETKEEVDKWCNFECEGDINEPVKKED